MKAAAKTRQAKTPRQRAEEQLGVAERKFSRLADQVKTLTAELEALTKERDLAAARADYLAQHPDLKPGLDVPLPLGDGS